MPDPIQPHRFGVLGSGAVGQTLARGLKAHGYDVRIGTRSPGKLAGFATETGIPAGAVADVARWSEVVVLAVLGSAALEALAQAGAANLAGKPVLDTTNPLSHDPPVDGVLRVFTGPNESLMERLQAAYPDAAFVKVFNSVGYALMVDPVIPGGRPSMFYCGNDPAAKAMTARLLEEFGWEGEDLGTATAARALEPLAVLWCIPGFRHDDWRHAFRMVRPQAARRRAGDGEAAPARPADPRNDLFAAVRQGDRERVRAILARTPAAANQRDPDGATPLHYAAELGDREIVALLLDAGADLNARDARFGATPAGWAIEYLRQRGALLAIEIEDAARATREGDAGLLQLYLRRFPALQQALTSDGTPLRRLARNSPDPAIVRLFEADGRTE